MNKQNDVQGGGIPKPTIWLRTYRQKMVVTEFVDKDGEVIYFIVVRCPTPPVIIIGPHGAWDECEEQPMNLTPFKTRDEAERFLNEELIVRDGGEG